MEIVGIYEARTRLSELIDRVSEGKEVTITRHGVPVARIVPVDGVIDAGKRIPWGIDCKPTFFSNVKPNAVFVGLFSIHDSLPDAHACDILFRPDRERHGARRRPGSAANVSLHCGVFCVQKSLVHFG